MCAKNLFATKTRRRRVGGTLLCVIGLALFAACRSAERKPSAEALKTASGYVLQAPLGLELTASAFYVPPDNPLTEAKIKLGKRLFFDKALSLDNSLSCASCHIPEKAFADPNQFSLGVKGKKGARQTPTIINRAFSRAQFWDGRAATLEEQALGPITNPVEMAQPSSKSVVARLRQNPGYLAAFKAAFPEAQDAISEQTIGRAIASFERTIMSGNSPYDRYQAGEQNALSEAAKRGLAIFNNKGACASCHVSFNFSDESYHNLGVGMAAKKPDWGRYALTKLDGQQGARKTPTLREIARTAPYMSDGSLKTLAEVVAFYNRGGQFNNWLSPKLKPLNLTEQEQADLIEFLQALSGEVVWYGKEEDAKQAGH